MSMQKGNFSTQRKIGSKAFEGLVNLCLLYQSTVLQITQLHFFLEEQNTRTTHSLWPLQRLDFIGLKQLLWS